MMDPLMNAQRKTDVQNNRLYRWLTRTARVMDKWGVDPIFGFLFPAFGDIFTSLMTLPYLYFSIFRLRSLPLTLAIFYNMMVDMVVGLLPYGVGDLCDIFYRSYIKNSRLLTGYVEGDRQIMNKVNQRAGVTAVLIVLLCVVFGLLLWAVVTLLSSSISMLSGCLGK